MRRFVIQPQRVRLGDRISIAADLASDAPGDQRLVVDYRIHYARAGGKTAPKVFKLKTFELAAGEAITLAISQTIRDFSTRRHYPGRAPRRTDRQRARRWPKARSMLLPADAGE